MSLHGQDKTRLKQFLWTILPGTRLDSGQALEPALDSWSGAGAYTGLLVRTLERTLELKWAAAGGLDVGAASGLDFRTASGHERATAGRLDIGTAGGLKGATAGGFEQAAAREIDFGVAGRLDWWAAGELDWRVASGLAALAVIPPTSHA